MTPPHLERDAVHGGIEWRRHHDLETEAASLTDDPSGALPLAAAADCAVRTDMLGDVGPSPLDAVRGLLWPDGVRPEWQVAVEMAVAREIGMRQRPLPWRYCMADPMSSSMSFATWCSVTVRLSSAEPFPFLPPFALIQSPPPPCRSRKKEVCGGGICESENAGCFCLSSCVH